jgi:hypothetical protein
LKSQVIVANSLILDKFAQDEKLFFLRMATLLIFREGLEQAGIVEYYEMVVFDSLVTLHIVCLQFRKLYYREHLTSSFLDRLNWKVIRVFLERPSMTDKQHSVNSFRVLVIKIEKMWCLLEQRVFLTQVCKLILA